MKDTDLARATTPVLIPHVCQTGQRAARTSPAWMRARGRNYVPRKRMTILLLAAFGLFRTRHSGISRKRSAGATILRVKTAAARVAQKQIRDLELGVWEERLEENRFANLDQRTSTITRSHAVSDWGPNLTNRIVSARLSENSETICPLGRLLDSGFEVPPRA